MLKEVDTSELPPRREKSMGTGRDDMAVKLASSGIDSNNVL